MFILIYRFVTKLSPKLIPIHQCNVVPRQVCTRKYKIVRIKKPLSSVWCGDDIDSNDSNDIKSTNDDVRETDRTAAIGVKAVDDEELINDNSIGEDKAVIEDASVEEHEKNDANLIIAADENTLDEDDNANEAGEDDIIEDPFIDLKTEYPLTEEEQRDLENFNIELELFRARIDNDFQRQDFSQFVDVEEF